MRNMETKFDWCIRFSRTHFRVLHLDIFAKTERLSLGFWAILIFNLIMLGGGCYTVCYYDGNIAFNASLTAIGTTQVCIRWHCGGTHNGLDLISVLFRLLSNICLWMIFAWCLVLPKLFLKFTRRTPQKMHEITNYAKAMELSRNSSQLPFQSAITPLQRSISCQHFWAVS